MNNPAPTDLEPAPPPAIAGDPPWMAALSRRWRLMVALAFVAAALFGGVPTGLLLYAAETAELNLPIILTASTVIGLIFGATGSLIAYLVFKP